MRRLGLVRWSSCVLTLALATPAIAQKDDAPPPEGKNKTQTSKNQTSKKGDAKDRSTSERDTSDRNTSDRNDSDRDANQDRSRDTDRNSRDRDSNDRSTSDNQSQGWLGILVENLAQQRGGGQAGTQQPQEGVVVRGVYPSGPAARAGFRVGDVIVSIDGSSVADSESAIDAIQDLEPGKTAEFTVTRAGQNLTLKPTIAERSRFMGSQQASGQGFQQGSGQRFQQGQSSNFQGGVQQAGGAQNQQRFFRGSDFGDEVPHHAMMLENARRMAEQNQRIEERLDKLAQEVEALRKQLGSKGGDSKGSDSKE